jgi:hypothetical protein
MTSYSLSASRLPACLIFYISICKKGFKGLILILLSSAKFILSTDFILSTNFTDFILSAIRRRLFVAGETFAVAHTVTLAHAITTVRHNRSCGRCEIFINVIMLFLSIIVTIFIE